MKNVLIVGGTSGIGLQLALDLKAKGDNVFVTGRNLKTAKAAGLTAFSLTIGQGHGDLLRRVTTIVDKLPVMDLYVHSAGFYQHGLLGELYSQDIVTAINTAILTPVFVIQSLCRRQIEDFGFIAITSTSATLAREKEPIYCSAKAGLSMLAWTAAYDPHISRALEVAPSGTDSPFWRGTDKDRTGLLSVQWVATQIQQEWDKTNYYRSVILQRNPDKVLVLKDQ